jgi:hypothetical protein
MTAVISFLMHMILFYFFFKFIIEIFQMLAEHISCSEEGIPWADILNSVCYCYVLNSRMFEVSLTELMESAQFFLCQFNLHSSSMVFVKLSNSVEACTGVTNSLKRGWDLLMVFCSVRYIRCETQEENKGSHNTDWLS